MTAQDQDIKSNSRRKETKQRIPHLLLDTDFFEKPENQLLTERFGIAGPAGLMLVCCRLMNQNQAGLPRTQIDALRVGVGISKEIWTGIIDTLIEVGWLVFTDEDRTFLTSPRIAEERARVLEKRRIAFENGKTGGRPKTKPKTKTKPIENQNRTGSTDTDTDTDHVIDPVIQYGKFLRMTQSEMDEVIKKYGLELVQQEMPEADLWIERAKTPSARRYREPKHNHYLFFRTTWLSGKRLKQPNGAAPKQDKNLAAAMSFMGVK